jgi:glycosyltransferase involved in cell wall biosynthesis
VRDSVFFYTDSPFVGGAERALLMLAGSLDADRWQPTLLIGAAPAATELERLAGDAGVPSKRVSDAPLGVAGARRLPELARMLRRERPQLFHAHLSWPLAAKYALAAAVIARVPGIVATVQLVPDFRPDRSSLVQLRALAAGIDRYIAVSRDIAQQLVDRFRWPASKVVVVYNAVQLERFGAQANGRLRSELRAADDEPIILTCARLHAQKGHAVLLDAAAAVPGARFVIAGDGPESYALHAQAERLGLRDRVVFLGHREDIPQLLAACDVFALPSIYEGSPIAVLEAMASGRAVVSSAIGGTDELIVNGDSGLLVPPGDPAALASALRRLVDDRPLRARLGARARLRAESGFSAEAATRAVAGIYEEVLAGA